MEADLDRCIKIVNGVQSKDEILSLLLPPNQIYL